MTSRVVLHVGLMKSGTTYLQSKLFANRRELRRRGLLVPGRRWAEQIHAHRSLVADDGGAWPRQVETMLAFDGTSVISVEMLAHVRPAVAQRAVESLAGCDELRVVVTARDLNRSLAAMWQETVQNGASWRWSDYLTGAEAWRPGHRSPAGTTAAGRTFWNAHNLYRIARTWSQAGGSTPLTLVTVPPPGAPREVLWERFASVLGVDPHGLREPPRSNESVGAASAMMLRLLNEGLESEGLGRQDGLALRKRHLAKQVLGPRRSQEPAIGLDVAPWVRQHSRWVRRRLATLDLDLVGDLDDLDPVPVAGIDPESVDEAEVHRAAMAALVGMMARQIRRDATARKAGTVGGRDEADDHGDLDDHDDHVDDGDHDGDEDE